MDPSSPTRTPDSPVKQTSKLFCAADADVTYISSDNVVFKIHSAYLTLTTSSGFAKVSEDMQVGTEPVQLPEHSTVLEVLFQFIEPPDEERQFRQPSVTGLDPTLLFAVAEAAEKYVVYGAMNICVSRMQQIVSQYPLNILNHCAKHGYLDSELANQAAVCSIVMPFSATASVLTVPGLLPRWLVYYGYWHAEALSSVIRLEDYALGSSPKCGVWHRACAIYSLQVNENPATVNRMPFLRDDDPALRCTKRYCSCDCLFEATFWNQDIFLNMTTPVPKL